VIARPAKRAAGAALAVALPLLLAACGGPSPTTLSVEVSASAQLNPNADNQPSPTVVRLYDLKSTDTFTNATFNDLFYKDAATLGGDMLGRKEIEMLPGQSMRFKREAESGTKYVGVIAGFRSLQGLSWRATMPLQEGEGNPIVVTLGPNVITVAKKPSSGLFGAF
jgi:type VI secretion system protein VasD